MTCAHFATIVNAQDSWPLENSFSPLASFPLLRGEAKFSLFMPTLQNGEFEDRHKVKRDLKSFYNIKPSDTPFTDIMVRFQLGRFSSRTHYEWKEFFAGNGASSDRAIDFSGFRQGFDVDIFLGNKSRVGFNIDCSFYGPVFTVIDNRVTGPQHSWTTGIHGLYNPTWNIFGMSAVAEAWARWPIGGTSVTDYQVSGGLKWPDTVLGSFSIQVGYRSTSLSFAENSKGNVNATWDGVFGSISYYYH
ncbi:MAG: hypothetical protein V1897_08950 [Pseudomonadota bacterium]